MTSTSFHLTRTALDLRFRRAMLAEREWLAPTLVRLRFDGEELDGFDSPGSDDHVRLFFGAPAATPPSHEEMRGWVSREYTPLAWGRDSVTVEFVIHDADGEGNGPASRWAASAPVGSWLAIGGPRRSAPLVGEPGHHLLAGDLTALPAIRRFVAAMPPLARGQVLLESAVPASGLRLQVPAGVSLDVIAPQPGAPSAALALALDSLRASAPDTRDVFAFIAAEQSIVRPGRALIEEAWGLDLDRAIIKGYWKRGTAEYHAPR